MGQESADGLYNIAGLTSSQIKNLPSMKKNLLTLVTILGGIIQTFVFGTYCDKCAGSSMAGFGGLVLTSSVTNILQYAILNNF